MIQFANGMTDDDVKAAAKYFWAMKWSPWIKVVETNNVPKIRNVGHMFLALEGGEKEPIAAIASLKSPWPREANCGAS